MTPTNALHLLTAEQDEFLRRQRRLEVACQTRVARRWEDSPIILEVDATALAILVESAAVGHRLYELMWLRRPGDLLRYWVAKVIAAPEEAIRRIDEGVSVVSKAQFGWPERGSRLPFLDIDVALGHFGDSYWFDPDMYGAERAWVEFRWAHPRALDLDAMFEVIRSSQDRLRSTATGLLAHELGLMDASRHVRDVWPTQGIVPFSEDIPVGELTIDRDMVEVLIGLVSREDVRSLSCDFDDRAFWREMVWVQVRRAMQQGVDPEEALLLAGPDGGLRQAHPQDWGGEVHIPYEGIREADVFVVPDWFVFDQARAQVAGTVAAGLSGKAGRYAIFDRDVGDFPHDDRLRCGRWAIYRLGVRSSRG